MPDDLLLLMTVFTVQMVLFCAGIAILVSQYGKYFFASNDPWGKRRRELRSWAESKGFTFREGPDDQVARRFEYLNPGGASGRHALNIMEGTLSGRTICAFDYGPFTNNGPYGSAVIVRTGLRFPPMVIRPAGTVDRAVEFAGYQGVELESAQFSQQFYVSAADPRSATEVLPQTTMEFLMQSPRFCLEFLDTEVIAYYRDRPFSPADFETATKVIAGILDRLPAKDSRTAQPEVRGPGIVGQSSPSRGFSGISPAAVGFFCLFLSILIDVTSLWCGELHNWTPLFVEFLLATVLAPAIWGLYLRNALVRALNTCQLAWADVDAELKRRYDLVPRLANLVETYANHEKSLLESVIQACNAAVASQGSPASQARDENALVDKIRQLLVAVQGYPELGASQEFLQLQDELVNTENRIQRARRFYNNSVRAYNNRIEVFPSTLIARLYGLKRWEFFMIRSAIERQNPVRRLEPVVV